MALLRLSSPFLASKNSVSLQMFQVLLAMVPGIIAMVYFFGVAVIINIILAIVVAVGAESLMLRLRNRPIKPFIMDGSAIVTAVLLAVSIPPLAPWWLTVLGVAFAIIFAKHLYGGLGYNPFNPAMMGYVLLLVSYPLQMTTWLPVQSLSQHPLDWGNALQWIFNGHLGAGLSIDSISGATPLDAMKTQVGQKMIPQHILSEPLYGIVGGKGWEWINVWFAIGGLFLLYRKVISWHVPVALLTGLFAISGITYLLDPTISGSPLFHLFSGGVMLGAFFIATDPVSGSTTLKGRLVFGAGVGLLTYIIRIWGGYPDAIAFSVIIMNMLVPLIDYYTQPKIYGARK